MGLLTKVLDRDKDFLPVERGPVASTIVERGSLQARQTSDVYCRVRPVQADGKATTIATTIKWIIDDGTIVKQGDRLIEFDDSAHMNLLRKQKDVAAKTDADAKRAAENLERIKDEHQIDVKLAKADVLLAQLALEQYKGPDATQKKILAVQVERAELLMLRTQLRAKFKVQEADDDLASKKVIADRERESMRNLEKEVANCIITAPQDGMVVYHISEQSRFGSRGSVVAQGEPVREGQKLLYIPDLSKMAVNTRVHEAVVARVRAGQKAVIRVDAFPGRPFTGLVQDISAVPSAADFFSSDVKLYATTISFDGDNKGLRPGMSAEVAIVVDERLKCLRVPTSAILGRGEDRYCYVLIGRELHKRELTVGLSDGKFVETKDGVKEGEIVLRNPPAVAGRLADEPKGQPEAPKLKATQIRLRSVKLSDDPGKTLIRTFGLTPRITTPSRCWTRWWGSCRSADFRTTFGVLTECKPVT